MEIPNFPNYRLGPEIGSPCDSLGLGLEELQHKDFRISIYPNPNEGQFTVNYRLPRNMEGSLEVITLLGEEVYSLRLPPWSSLQQLNLSTLSQGIYIVKISCNGKAGYGKFVKE